MVAVFMQLLQLGAHLGFPSDLVVIANTLIAHCFFFGLPVGFVVAKTAPR